LTGWIPKSLRIRLSLLAVGVLAIGFGVFQGYMAVRVGYGVRVAGIPVGGLSRAAAAARVQARLDAAGVLTAHLLTAKRDIAIPVADLGFTVNAAHSVEIARQKGRVHVFGGALWLWPSGSALLDVQVDPALYAQAVAPMHKLTDVAARDATLELVGSQVRVLPSKDGTQLDEVALERSILASLEQGRAFAGPLPTVIASAKVTTADAQSRAELARVYVSSALTLRYRGMAVVLTPATIARMLSVNTGSGSATAPLTFGNPRAEKMLHMLFSGIETQPVDAQVDVTNGQVTITASEDGMLIDMPRLVGDLDAVAQQSGLRQVFVAIRDVPPKLSTDDLRNLGLSALGSQFSTFFDPNNQARATNLAQAAKLVDGTLVGPGEIFSLNAAMGPRTINRGFDYAPVIGPGGVLRPGVGGGICQYATTLFNAVFFAGLPIVERHAHSLLIDHYPMGRDATVSWGSADLKFRNDTSKTLMVRSWVTHGELTVVIVGTTGRKVTYTTTPYYDIRQPATSKSHPKIIYDSFLAKGIVRWEPGGPGKSVAVTRTVWQNGSALFTDTFRSTYQPKDWIERVGTGQ
jgi:vancomycin resistance protein YoaR